MNARVFMVFVFSAIFMGIWNSDQKAMNSTIARNKRLSKAIAVFPMPLVETVRRENLFQVDFPVPEPRPVRVAMRASHDVGQSEPVIERQDEHSLHRSAVEVPVVTLTPISEGVPTPQKTSGEAETIPTNQTVEGVDEETVELLVVEPTTREPIIPELAITESETASLTESVLTEFESAAVDAPEDFSVEVQRGSRVAESETETTLTEDVATKEVAVNVAQAETAVSTEAAIMVAENFVEVTVADHSDDVPVQSEQPVAKSPEAELPEPADPIVEKSIVYPDAVALNETQSNIVDANAGESNEVKKLHESTLLNYGEYDMLDVHAKDVTPGTVEPPIDGGSTCIPMPRNLASGTWQVIHSSGEFFKITVDRGRNSSVKYDDGIEDVLETSFCVTTTPDGVRWCFIRSFVDPPSPVRRVTTEFFSPGQQ